GQGVGIVTATGTRTEIGRITRMISAIDDVSTPLMRKMNRFSFQLAVTILLFAVLTFAFGVLLRGHDASDMFLRAVALVASAIPEGLPAIMTVTLALGVQRMARQHAIVRRLPAVETLGSVTIICSDKTGTLTRNEMTVQRLVCAENAFDIEGVGYEPVGRFMLNDQPVEVNADPVLERVVTVGALCNDALLSSDGQNWWVEGDPTEGALIVLGRKAGKNEGDLGALWP